MNDRVWALALAAAAISVLVASTVFFHYVEHWAWVDSWFFTVVTVSTVGYGNLVPQSTLGKIGTTVLIFVGIGVFAAVFTRIGNYVVRRRVETMDHARRKHDIDHPQSSRDKD